ncbi:MAG TPA: nuclear transport factor 2 family protein [Thermoanaerobaculia bacterium]|nr:nuclear transport factor 2 family protein [Thermoanaerobaculia bacterium]
MRAALVLLVVVSSACTATTPRGDDGQAVVAATERLFAAMQSRDDATLRELLHEDARFVVVRPDGSTRVRTGDEWRTQIVGDSANLEERMFDPEVRVKGDVATLWSRYVFLRGGAFSHCGTNSVQYVRQGQRWRVVSIVFSYQTEGCAGRERPSA